MMSNCDQCSVKFNLLKRKSICEFCQVHHCSDCLSKINIPLASQNSFPNASNYSSSPNQNSSSPIISGWNNFTSTILGQSSNKKACQKCRVFLEVPVNVPAISSLRVKDLRYYLKRHNVDAGSCTEKRELVNLVANQIIQFRRLHDTRNSGSSSSSRQSSSSFSRTPQYSNSNYAPRQERPLTPIVIRDDGIRVQPMSLNPSNVTNECDDGNTSRQSSPSISEDFVVIEPQSHNDNVDEDNDVILESNDRGSDHNTEEGDDLENVITRESYGRSVDIEADDNAEVEPTVQPEPSPQQSVNMSAPPPDQDEYAPSTSTNITTLPETEQITLDSLADEESVRSLSVRQCKVLLAKHRVTATAIIEREELVNRVLLLWNSYRENKTKSETLPDDMLCKICMTNVIDSVLLECAHVVCCISCGKQLSQCPVCRQFVVRCIRTFHA